MKFTSRSYQQELLDGHDLPFADVRQNMRELDFINTWLGGHAVTLAGMNELVNNQEPLTVCEMGCGGGDNLRAIQRWAQRKRIPLRVIGIDINPDCVAIAREKFNSTARFIAADFRMVDFKQDKPDIVFSSLFCHHFTDEELTRVLQWMDGQSRRGFFINDLHRHPLAYHSIRLLTQWFSRSYLVKNDAPLSVLRGFVKKDWEELSAQSGITFTKIRWKWAFRWLVLYKKQ